MKAIPGGCFVHIPSEGAYLDAFREGWCIPRTGWGIAVIGIFPRDEAIQLAIAAEWPTGRRHIVVKPAPACACCGATEITTKLKLVDEGPPRQWRCDKHVGRNPCLVQGCGRTREGQRPQLDAYLCGRHWRPVPKYLKLAYNRIWRLKKKSGGWTDVLIERHWLIWRKISRRAEAAVHGHLDLAEIEKLFGVDV